MKIVLDENGRITLPDVVQSQLGVKPGDEVELIQDNGTWTIKRVLQGGTNKRIPGLHPEAIQIADDFDTPLPDEFWTGESS